MEPTLTDTHLHLSADDGRASLDVRLARAPRSVSISLGVQD